MRFCLHWKQRDNKTSQRGLPGRNRVAAFVGAQTVYTYWEIGKHIVEYEQNGHEKAEYGSDVLNRLSRDLTEHFGKGFSRGNVFYMRKLFITYPKLQTLYELLTWSHYVELLKIEDSLERSFYEKEAEAEHWGVREMKRQMKSMLFQRIALSTDKVLLLTARSSPGIGFTVSEIVEIVRCSLI